MPGGSKVNAICLPKQFTKEILPSPARSAFMSLLLRSQRIYGQSECLGCGRAAFAPQRMQWTGNTYSHHGTILHIGNVCGTVVLVPSSITFRTSLQSSQKWRGASGA